jgi:hypothetical protein
VLHIQHKQAMRVRLHALQTDRLAAQVCVRIQHADSVNAPASNARVADFGEVDEAVLLCRGEVYIVYVAKSRIVAFVESEGAVEEVEAGVGSETIEGLAVGEGDEADDHEEYEGHGDGERLPLWCELRRSKMVMMGGKAIRLDVTWKAGNRLRLPLGWIFSSRKWCGRSYRVPAIRVACYECLMACFLMSWCLTISARQTTRNLSCSSLRLSVESMPARHRGSRKGIAGVGR